MIYMFDVCILSYRLYHLFVLFNQKTAYEMRISDWSSDVCSSDLLPIKKATRMDRRAAFKMFVNSRRMPPAHHIRRYAIDRANAVHVLRWIVPLAVQKGHSEIDASDRLGMLNRRQQRILNRRYIDRTSVVLGKRWSVRVDLGG